MLFGVLVGSACFLQGCQVSHTMGNWRSVPSYLRDFEYAPGENEVRQLNSCAATAPAPAPCSGNGVCRQMNLTSGRVAPITFCECDRDWADPECRTRRKSQTVAFALSLFGGIIGLDEFYLGNFGLATAKMSTLGGFGVWWMFDIVRIGCAPVYSYNFRLAADLPHSTFVMVTFAVFSLIGLAISMWAVSSQERQKITRKMMKTHDDWVAYGKATPLVDSLTPEDRIGVPIAGHGVPRRTPFAKGFDFYGATDASYSKQSNSWPVLESHYSSENADVREANAAMRRRLLANGQPMEMGHDGGYDSAGLVAAAFRARPELAARLQDETIEGASAHPLLPVPTPVIVPPSAVPLPVPVAKTVPIKQPVPQSVVLTAPAVLAAPVTTVTPTPKSILMAQPAVAAPQSAPVVVAAPRSQSPPASRPLASAAAASLHTSLPTPVHEKTAAQTRAESRARQALQHYDTGDRVSAAALSSGQATSVSFPVQAETPLATSGEEPASVSFPVLSYAQSTAQGSFAESLPGYSPSPEPSPAGSFFVAGGVAPVNVPRQFNTAFLDLDRVPLPPPPPSGLTALPKASGPPLTLQPPAV